jgi:hypothetical protein
VAIYLDMKYFNVLYRFHPLARPLLHSLGKPDIRIPAMSGVTPQGRKPTIMKTADPKPLPTDLNISCYACESQGAVYLCRYVVDNLNIQVCLCEDCMKLDTDQLLKQTVGIDARTGDAAASYLTP